MKVLVTGATGFVGGEIVKKLVSENFEVVGTSKTGSSDNVEFIEIVKADITNAIELKETFRDGKFDAVIHSAGLAHQFGNTTKEQFEKVNVQGTKNVSELAVGLGAKHFILISSTAVYGFHQNKVDENTECKPDTDYAKSKLDGEKVCLEVCEKNNIKLTIFRLAPVLGEKGIGNVPRLIGAIFKNRFIWVGDGSNKKSLIYVGDISEACLKILRSKKDANEIFNLAAPPVEMKKLVSIIKQTLNKKIPKLSIPKFLPGLFFTINRKTVKLNAVEKFSDTFEKWLSDDVYSAEKIKTVYGFETKTSIEDAVKKQCLWYLEQKKSN